MALLPCIALVAVGEVLSLVEEGQHGDAHSFGAFPIFRGRSGAGRNYDNMRKLRAFFWET